MKTHSKAPLAAYLLAALIPFAAAAFAADPAKPDSGAAPTPTAALPNSGASQAPAPETALHEIGGSGSSAAAPAPAGESTPNPLHYHRNSGDENQVTVDEANVVGPAETVEGNAVAIMGPLTVEGTVEGNAVSVLGRNTVNGTVHGNAVAVLGNLTLGPNARVDGNAVSVGGRVIKDPAARVGGNIVPLNFSGGLVESPGASEWWHHGLRMGRPIPFGSHLHFFWIVNILLIAFYVALAALFPGGIRKCADTLAQRPGITFLTGVLSMLGLPFLFILLFVTVVGIPVAVVVLPLAVVSCIMFGKAAAYSFVGRSIAGQHIHAALAVLIGVLVLLVLYMVPVLGLALWLLVAFLGFACALTTLFTSIKPAAPAGTPPAAPAQAAAAVGVAAVAPAAAEVAPPPIAGLTPPVIPAPAGQAPAPADRSSEVALPRAGFWIRMVALLIDAILVGIVTHMSDWFLPVLALYGALLWKLRGATIGGIIFGLKVVRLDGKPSEWVTVVVRALACFFSLIVIGLGFIWIAFDPEKQGWHDKIAGTVVVRQPRGVSLV